MNRPERAVAATADQQPPQAQQQGGSCGNNTMAFGCHAYIYGNSASAASYAGRADTVFVDAQHMSKDSGLIQKLNQAGPYPLFYVNAYCESRFGGCPGPRLSGSGVAAQYNEVAQHPTSKEFFDNFNRQIAWVTGAKGKVIEIDNMDFYIEKGHKSAIIKLIQIAGQAGLNVLSKNVKDTEILKQPNVVGVVVEEGSGNASEYISAFTSVGKPCAGILMINAKNKSGNQYTSFTECDHPSRGSKSEYTKCSCTKNPAGMRLGTTPVAGPGMQVPPANTQPEQTPQTQQTGVTTGAYTPGASSSPLGSYAPSGGSSVPASAPQTPQPQPQPQPYTPPNTRPTGVQDPSVKKTEPKDMLVKTPEVVTKPQQKVTKKEQTVFQDPLGGKEGSREADPDSAHSTFSTQLRCAQKPVIAGTRTTISWDCGPDATRSESRGFVTQDLPAGATKVAVNRTSTYTLRCFNEEELVGEISCTVAIKRNTSPDSFRAQNQLEQPQSTKFKTMCFLSFCI